LEVALPRHAVVFTPATYTFADLKKYGDPRGIQHCRVDNGKCRFWNSYQISRVLAFDGDRAILRRGGVDYTVEFPNKALLETDIVDYTAMVIAYLRGNWFQVIDLAERLIQRADRTSTSVLIDAYLYRGAARYRTGNSGRADFEDAIRLNPLASRSRKFLLMGVATDVMEKRQPLTELKKTWKESAEMLRAYEFAKDLDEFLTYL